ncbi:MerR family transcriptional regulator [Novosphingobium colocasiae]|uniref:MerR family transcriptional regulator n=1 Tax=Novosphingobium colocasiae TaxID=1256513 RepID=UPI0035B42E65
MKMRELEARTGVNRETIRVLFREGLLPEPSRPARNVADYGEDHVRAILAVRKLQLDSRMTLPQIKAAMQGQGGDTQIGAAAFSQLEDLVSTRVGVDKGYLAIDALLDKNPKALVDAKALANLGIIELIDGDGGPQISLTDAGLLNIWCRMREAGFDEDHGFPPDILSYYVEGSEYIAANEAKIFLDQVEGRIGQTEAAAMLELALPFMLDFFGILRQKAFLRMIRAKTREGATIDVPRLGGKRRRRTTPAR